MKKKISILVAAIVCVLGVTFAGGDAFAAKDRCIAGGSGGETESYCAAKLSRNASNVKINCKGSNASQGACWSSVNGQVDCGGGTGSNCADTKRSFVDGVVSKLMSGENLDPCGSYTDATEKDTCKQENWQYYYVTVENANRASSSTEGGEEEEEEEETIGSLSTPKEGDCSSILPDSWCDRDSDSGIIEIIKFIINILTGTIVLAGTTGFIICGIMWMTARENEQQVATAKRRMRDIVIGIIAWVLIYMLSNLFIPKKQSDLENPSTIVTEMMVK